MIALLRRLFRRTPRPCHVSYAAVEDYRVEQGMAVCLTCGTFHLTKPRLSYQYLKDILGS